MANGYIKVTYDTIEEVFTTMLVLENKASENLYDNRDYFEQAEGAFKILQSLGLSRDYINWAIGK